MDAIVAFLILVVHMWVMLIFMLEESHANQTSNAKRDPVLAEVTVFSSVLTTMSIEFFKTTVEVMLFLLFTSIASGNKYSVGCLRRCLAGIHFNRSEKQGLLSQDSTG